MIIVLLIASVIFALIDGMELADAGADAIKVAFFGLWAVTVGLNLGYLLYKPKN